MPNQPTSLESHPSNLYTSASPEKTTYPQKQNPSWLTSPHAKPTTGAAQTDRPPASWLTKPKPTPRASTVAVTLPPPLILTRFNFPGGRPTDEEWRAMQDHFTAHPEQRIKLSTAHPDQSRQNCYFLGYHKDYRGGERWGTKEQLVKRRRSVSKAQTGYRKRKIELDPEYRVAQAARFAAFVTKKNLPAAIKKEADDEDLTKKRKRLAKHYKRRAIAKKLKKALTKKSK